MEEFSRKELVKRARLASEMSQIRFENVLERKQETISRYECGLLKPPDDVVIRCIRILEKREGLKFFTEDQEMVQLLVQLLKFEGQDNGPKREALKAVMSALLKD